MEKHSNTEICSQPGMATTCCDHAGLSQNAIEIKQI